MTIKQTLAAINALPNCRAIYKSEYKEFRIRFNNDPACDYFTDDRDDALSSAQWFVDGRLEALNNL